MVTCGEMLVQLLVQYEVDTVFGIPGVHTMELYRGLQHAPIRHITPRHEQAGGFMADGYARASGRPGVCFVITGPGITNVATAMGQAYGDSVPLLVISSVNRSHSIGLGYGQLHELRAQQTLTAGLTAFSHTLIRPDELPQVLARAFTVFQSARPRPVHIEIPLDVLDAPASHVDTEPRPLPSAPGPDPATISRIAQLLGQSERVVILAGGGAVAAATELRQLAERLGAPVALTNNARGLLPPDHPLLVDGIQATRAGRALFDQADVVLAIGTELGETDYEFGPSGAFRARAPLVRIDIDPLQVCGVQPARISLVSDARLALAALLAALPQQRPASGWGPRRADAANTAVRATWTARQRSFAALLETIRDTLVDPILVGDSTQPVYQGMECYRAPLPRSWFTSATGYGTLGYALPAAIGAKLVRPDRPVVALAGDGGFQFSLADLASAHQLGMELTVLVWNNRGYQEIREHMQADGITPLGVDVAAPDFVTVATGMGAAACRAGGRAELARLLSEVRGRNQAMLIELDAGGAW